MALHSVKGTLERCKHSEGWIEVRGGCWHVWGWIIVSFQTCTICMFGFGLQPLHSSHTELLGWGVGSPRHPRFSMAYNNGPHSGSTTHLALSDKWFWKRTHTASSPVCSLCAQKLHCPLLYSISVRMIFLAFFDIRYYAYPFLITLCCNGIQCGIIAHLYSWGTQEIEFLNGKKSKQLRPNCPGV